MYLKPSVTLTHTTAVYFCHLTCDVIFSSLSVLNEGLVKFLMDRDDLHMEQDSMLVDIEDLTRYL